MSAEMCFYTLPNGYSVENLPFDDAVCDKLHQVSCCSACRYPVETEDMVSECLNGDTKVGDIDYKSLSRKEVVDLFDLLIARKEAILTEMEPKEYQALYDALRTLKENPDAYQIVISHCY